MVSRFDALLGRARARQRAIFLCTAVLSGAGVLLLLLLLVQGRGVRVQVLPEDVQASIDIQGPGLVLGQAVYTLGRAPELTITAPGYQPHTAELGQGDTLTVRLQPLPGRVHITVQPVTEAIRWTVNGQELARAPHLDRELAAGTHRLRVSHPYYQAEELTVQLQPGEQRRLHVELAPLVGRLHLASEPAAAAVVVNGLAVGLTPLVLEQPGGRHEVLVQRDGYARIRDVVELSEQRLEVRRNYRLVRTGSPAGAKISETRAVPAPNSRQAPARQDQAGASSSSRGGPPHGPHAPPSEPALPHAGATPPSEPARQYVNQAGGTMRLFRPEQPFLMGAARHEPGQRANEYIRRVHLRRPFYAGVHELRVSEYSRFRAIAGEPSHPAVELAWLDIVRFCNWLSEQEGLAPFYTIGDGGRVRVNPSALGYRLLTEAEWEWLAREAGEGKRRRFVWGNEPVLPPQVANVADESARGKVRTYIPGYRDGHSGLAPAGSFPPEPSGLHDLAGNASEWTHDFYSALPPSQTGVVLDPLGPSQGQGHVIKGGNWRSGTLRELRAAFRSSGVGARDVLGARLGRYAE